MALPFTGWGRAAPPELPLPHRHGRAGFTPLLRGVVPVTRSDQLSYHPGTRPGLWVGTPQPLSHLRPAGARDGTSPVELRLQDLHDSGQQQDTLEKIR